MSLRQVSTLIGQDHQRRRYYLHSESGGGSPTRLRQLFLNQTLLGIKLFHKLSQENKLAHIPVELAIELLLYTKEIYPHYGIELLGDYGYVLVLADLPSDVICAVLDGEFTHIQIFMGYCIGRKIALPEDIQAMILANTPDVLYESVNSKLMALNQNPEADRRIIDNDIPLDDSHDGPTQVFDLGSKRFYVKPANFSRITIRQLRAIQLELDIDQRCASTPSNAVTLDDIEWSMRRVLYHRPKFLGLDLQTAVLATLNSLISRHIQPEIELPDEKDLQLSELTLNYLLHYEGDFLEMLEAFGLKSSYHCLSLELLCLLHPKLQSKIQASNVSLFHFNMHLSSAMIALNLSQLIMSELPVEFWYRFSDMLSPEEGQPLLATFLSRPENLMRWHENFSTRIYRDYEMFSSSLALRLIDHYEDNMEALSPSVCFELIVCLAQSRHHRKRICSLLTDINLLQAIPTLFGDEIEYTENAYKPNANYPCQKQKRKQCLTAFRGSVVTLRLIFSRHPLLPAMLFRELKKAQLLAQLPVALVIELCLYLKETHPHYCCELLYGHDHMKLIYEKHIDVISHLFDGSIKIIFGFFQWGFDEKDIDQEDHDYLKARGFYYDKSESLPDKIMWQLRSDIIRAMPEDIQTVLSLNLQPTKSSTKALARRWVQTGVAESYRSAQINTAIECARQDLASSFDQQASSTIDTEPSQEGVHTQHWLEAINYQMQIQ